MKYRFDFNKPILQLTGDPFLDENTQEEMRCNRVLAFNLSTCMSFDDYVKLMDWARTLYSGKEFVLDASDSDRLEKIVKDNKTMYPIVKAAIMEIIKNKEKIEE